MKVNESKKNRIKVLIIGLGNPLNGDDGFGYHLVHYLKTRPLPYGVKVIEGGTDPFVLVNYLKNTEHVILVDVTQTGGIVGTFYKIPLNNLAEAKCELSLHQLSLLNLYQSPWLRQGLNLPKGTLLAVEVGEIELFSEELSERIRAKIPGIADRIMKEVKRHLDVELYTVRN